MEEKIVYIHIGMHKTATTSIQYTMFDNRDMLADFGYYYPKSFLINQSIYLLSMLLDNPESYYPNVKNQRQGKILEKFNEDNLANITKELEESRKSDVVVFSGEDLNLLTHDECTKLKHLINELCPDYSVKIICSTREYAEYTASAVQQKVKSSKLRELVLDDIQPLYKDLYRSRLEKYIDIFSKENIIVYKFEDSLKHENGPVGFFLETIGLSKDEIAKIKIWRCNDGIGRNAFDILLHINYRIPFVVDGEISSGRKKNDTNCIFDVRGGGKYRLPQTVYEHLEEFSADDRLWLKNEFGISYSYKILKAQDESKIIFDEDYLEDIIKVLDNTTLVITFLLKQYFIEKREDVDENSQKIVDKTIEEINNRYPFMNSDISLNKIIKKQNKEDLLFNKLIRKAKRRLAAWHSK